MNCWDYWKCPADSKDACPVFRLNMGTECWTFEHSHPTKCQDATKHGIASCNRCPFFIANNS